MNISNFIFYDFQLIDKKFVYLIKLKIIKTENFMEKKIN
jgi:hypothetical protein